MSIRICEIVTNLKNDKNEDLINIDNMKNLLVTRECIQKYAYIIHDKDVYTLDDESKNHLHKAGSLKAPHIHLLLKFRCPQQIGNVAKWFDIKPNSVQKVKSEAAATAYLIHANAPEKHQYELNEVISNFDVAQAIQKVQTKRSLNDVIDKILNGTICEYNKTTEIDPVMLVQQNKKIEMAFKVRAEHLLATKKDRNTECIFISGTSGSGKTTLAKRIADDKKLAYYVSSGSNDILDGYMQQPVLILDDIRPSTLGLSDLLKLLDNNTASTVKSRYKNKALYCDLIIITTVLDIDSFYSTVFKNSDEPIMQLKRRCGTYIKMDSEHIYISLWDSYKNDYSEPLEYENDVINIYRADHAKTTEEIEKNVSTLIPFLKRTDTPHDGFIQIPDDMELPFD